MARRKRKNKLTLQQSGIILLFVGIALLIWGFNISDTFGSRVNEFFTGSPSDKAMILIILGAICSAAGIFQLLKKR